MLKNKTSTHLQCTMGQQKFEAKFFSLMIQLNRKCKMWSRGSIRVHRLNVNYHIRSNKTARFSQQTLVSALAASVCLQNESQFPHLQSIHKSLPTKWVTSNLGIMTSYYHLHDNRGGRTTWNQPQLFVPDFLTAAASVTD